MDKAVEAARKAFQKDSPWRQLEPAARAKLIRQFATLLRRDLDYLSVISLLRTSLFNIFSLLFLEVRNIKQWQTSRGESS